MEVPHVSKLISYVQLSHCLVLYNEYFVGCHLTTYHLHVPTVLKSGSLNLLEPYGPVQTCNGIALPLPFPFPYPTFLKMGTICFSFL
jgi:hypothetical protein